MKNFLVLYYSPAGAMEAMKNMPEAEKSEMMKTWFEWKEDIGDALVDMGAPLMPGQVVGGGECPCESMPLRLSGHSMVQAEDINRAEALFKTHPMTNDENSVIKLHEACSM